jgi:hypothetical protein
MTMHATQKIQRFLDTITSNSHEDLDALVQALVSQDISAEDAECLIAFVPMAFAQVLLSPQGVKFQDAFLIRDFETNVSAKGLLGDEPLYVSARELAKEMAQGDDDSRRRLEEIASTSAEYSVAMQLAGNPRDLRGIVLTEAVLARVPRTHLPPASPQGLRRLWNALTRNTHSSR